MNLLFSRLTPTSQEAGGVSQKRLRVEDIKDPQSSVSPDYVSPEVFEGMLSDTADFFYDLGWNEREEVIIFISNRPTQFVNQ